MAIEPGRSSSDSTGTINGGADPGRVEVVPEHKVKAMLASHGVAVPPGTTDLKALGDLGARLVLKAYGPEIVHKSKIGAVRLGLSPSDVPAAVEEMSNRLAELNIHVDGYLVEQQVPSGVEIIVGIVDRGFGPMLTLGFGGSLTEILDDVAVRIAPVSPDSALEALLGLRGAGLLHDQGDGEPVDLGLLAGALVGICDTALALGSELSELECNPVIARADGSVAVDALLIRRAELAIAHDRVASDLTRMFYPRGVAVAGASTKRISHGNRYLEVLRRFGWEEDLYAIHPTATQIGNVAAYPSVSSIPGPVDYVISTVPADATAEVITGAVGKAQFVHVFASGFGEKGDDGRRGQQEILEIAKRGGLRIIGPNCMGVHCPTGRLAYDVSVPSHSGSVGFVSQSGGLATDMIMAGERRGLAFSKVVSIGNASDVTLAEVCEFFIEDTETRVISLYIEGTPDGAPLVRAMQRAHGVKPIVALVGGLSGQGARRTVSSHTGALAGDQRVWREIERATGITLVTTLEELLGAVTYLQRYSQLEAVGPGSVLVAGIGGGASVLAADACDRWGLDLPAIDAPVKSMLRGLGFGSGQLIENPLEMVAFPTRSESAIEQVVSKVCALQRYSDLLFHMNGRIYVTKPEGNNGRYLLDIVDKLADAPLGVTRVALVARNLGLGAGSLRDDLEKRARDKGVVMFDTFDEASVAIRAMQRFEKAKRSGLEKSISGASVDAERRSR